MKPEDVPNDLLSLYGRNYMGSSPAVAARRAMAAVIPEIQRRVLLAAADQLDAMPETDGAALQGPHWYRDGWKQATGMLRDWADYPPALAERIARGESR